MDRVTFYVVPDLTSPAKDLIDNQSEWLSCAKDALTTHLKKAPSNELLKYAYDWWPQIATEEAISLTERLKKFPDLINDFFTLKKVIDGSVSDVRDVVTEVVSEALAQRCPPGTKC